MKAKQLLLGISLLSILTACSDRFEEYPNSSDQNSDIDKKSSKTVKEDKDSSSVTTNLFNREGNLKTNTSQTSRTKEDSLSNKEIINETTTTPVNTGTGAQPETIDPTKPDRPK